MNNSTDRQRKDGGKGIGVVVVIGLILVSSLTENLGGRSIALIVWATLIAAVVFVAVYAGKKLKSEAKGKSDSGAHPYAPNTQSSTKPRENCGYSTANCDYSHEMERRREQLDSFLKNGIIGKEEYRIFMEKYEKSAQDRMKY